MAIKPPKEDVTPRPRDEVRANTRGSGLGVWVAIGLLLMLGALIYAISAYSA
jgi:hypothetical protein